MNKFLCAALGLILSTTVSAQTQPTNGAPQNGGLFPELGTAEANKPGKDAGLINLIVDDVTIVNPPMNGISFCVGKLIIQNNTNTTIQSMVLSVMYGSLNVPVSFGGVAGNGGEQTYQMAFSGSNCNSLLSMPTIKVESCVAGPMSVAECQAKLKYIPM